MPGTSFTTLTMSLFRSRGLLNQGRPNPMGNRNLYRSRRGSSRGIRSTGGYSMTSSSLSSRQVSRTLGRRTTGHCSRLLRDHQRDSVGGIFSLFYVRSSTTTFYGVGFIIRGLRDRGHASRLNRGNTRNKSNRTRLRSSSGGRVWGGV